MTVTYSIEGKIEGVDDFGLIQSDLIYSAILPATTATYLTIPGSNAGGNFSSTNRFLAVIRVESGGDVFVAVNATPAVAAAPTANNLNAATSQLAPKGLVVEPGDVLGFITRTADTDLTVSLYAV